METIAFVKKYEKSQELVNDTSSFNGTLSLTIETIGSDTTQQEKIKEHILSEVKRICSDISKDPTGF